MKHAKTLIALLCICQISLACETLIRNQHPELAVTYSISNIDGEVLQTHTLLPLKESEPSTPALAHQTLIISLIPSEEDPSLPHTSLVTKIRDDQACTIIFTQDKQIQAIGCDKTDDMPHHDAT